MSNVFNGPGGTSYMEIAAQQNGLAKIGVANLPNGRVRVRLQLAEGATLGTAPSISGLSITTPSGTNNRYSAEVPTTQAAVVLSTFISAMGTATKPTPVAAKATPVAATVAMAGTTGAAYTVVATRPDGTVIGYRDLKDGSFRVRVHPGSGKLNLNYGWTQPEPGNNRYSKVVFGEDGFNAALLQALAA